MASALSAVRDVDIDAEGTYKYVVIRVSDLEAVAGSADNRKVRTWFWSLSGAIYTSRQHQRAPLCALSLFAASGAGICVGGVSR
jgi:hypothetical protein